VSCNEVGIRCRYCIVCSELDKIELIEANCVCCSEFGIRCRNCIACSEFVIFCRIACSAVKLGFIVEDVLFVENLKFAAEIKLIAAN